MFKKTRDSYVLIYIFAWAPQRAARRDFRDGREWKCLTAIQQKRGRSKRGRIRTREKMRTRAFGTGGGGRKDERSLADEEEIDAKLKGGERKEGA